jgi:hypothetical protein
MWNASLARLRFAVSLTLGLPFSLRALDRLIDTLQAKGPAPQAPDALAGGLPRGLALDAETRQAMQLRRLRTQAIRAARETRYYQALFARLDLDPARLDAPTLARLPLTPKDALREDPDAFVCRTARPVFRTTTTGTTGRPTGVSFSAYEMATYIALSAIGSLGSGEITPADIVQLSTSARDARQHLHGGRRRPDRGPGVPGRAD